MQIGVTLFVLIIILILLAYLTAKSDKVKNDRMKSELTSLISAACFKACNEALESKFPELNDDDDLI